MINYNNNRFPLSPARVIELSKSAYWFCQLMLTIVIINKTLISQEQSKSQLVLMALGCLNDPIYEEDGRIDEDLVDEETERSGVSQDIANTPFPHLLTEGDDKLIHILSEFNVRVDGKQESILVEEWLDLENYFSRIHIGGQYNYRYHIYGKTREKFFIKGSQCEKLKPLADSILYPFLTEYLQSNWFYYDLPIKNFHSSRIPNFSDRSNLTFVHELNLGKMPIYGVFALLLITAELAKNDSALSKHHGSSPDEYVLKNFWRFSTPDVTLEMFFKVPGPGEDPLKPPLLEFSLHSVVDSPAGTRNINLTAYIVDYNTMYELKRSLNSIDRYLSSDVENGDKYGYGPLFSLPIGVGCIPSEDTLRLMDKNMAYNLIKHLVNDNLINLDFGGILMNVEFALVELRRQANVLDVVRLNIFLCRNIFGRYIISIIRQTPAENDNKTTDQKLSSSKRIDNVKKIPSSFGIRDLWDGISMVYHIDQNENCEQRFLDQKNDKSAPGQRDLMPMIEFQHNGIKYSLSEANLKDALLDLNDFHLISIENGRDYIDYKFEKRIPKFQLYFDSPTYLASVVRTYRVPIEHESEIKQLGHTASSRITLDSVMIYLYDRQNLMRTDSPVNQQPADHDSYKYLLTMTVASMEGSNLYKSFETVLDLSPCYQKTNQFRWMEIVFISKADQDGPIKLYPGTRGYIGKQIRSYFQEKLNIPSLRIAKIGLKMISSSLLVKLMVLERPHIKNSLIKMNFLKEMKEDSQQKPPELDLLALVEKKEASLSIEPDLESCVESCNELKCLAIVYCSSSDCYRFIGSARHVLDQYTSSMCQSYILDLERFKSYGPTVFSALRKLKTNIESRFSGAPFQLHFENGKSADASKVSIINQKEEHNLKHHYPSMFSNRYLILEHHDFLPSNVSYVIQHDLDSETCARWCHEDQYCKLFSFCFETRPSCAFSHHRDLWQRIQSFNKWDKQQSLLNDSLLVAKENCNIYYRKYQEQEDEAIPNESLTYLKLTGQFILAGVVGILVALSAEALVALLRFNKRQNSANDDENFDLVPIPGQDLIESSSSASINQRTTFERARSTN